MTALLQSLAAQQRRCHNQHHDKTDRFNHRCRRCRRGADVAVRRHHPLIEEATNASLAGHREHPRGPRLHGPGPAR